MERILEILNKYLIQINTDWNEYIVKDKNKLAKEIYDYKLSLNREQIDLRKELIGCIETIRVSGYAPDGYKVWSRHQIGGLDIRNSNQLVDKYLSTRPDIKPVAEKYEPYFGWCDVSGCKNEGCSGGLAWKETGYWTVCSKHSTSARNGDPQPKMKQSAMKREKSRDKVTGYLPAKSV
jgi:hypothetical protein